MRAQARVRFWGTRLAGWSDRWTPRASKVWRAWDVQDWRRLTRARATLRGTAHATPISAKAVQIRTAFTEGQPEGRLASRIVDELEVHGHFRIARPIGNFTND
jgi:hypothetical protein